MFDVDEDDADENNARENQPFGWDFAPEENQHDGRGKDGRLPGGCHDPARGILRAERDQRIKYTEANTA